MALWVCRRCATAYAVGVAACPQCGSTDYVPDWEAEVPNIITGVGPVNYLAKPGEVGYVPPAEEPEATPAAPAAPEPPPEVPASVPVPPEPAEALPEPPFGTESEPEGGDPLSALISGSPGDSSSQSSPAQEAGTSSSRSSDTASRSSSGGPASLLSPAPAVVSPSSTPPPLTAEPRPSSSAGSTDGSTPATGSAPSGSEGGVTG